MKKCTKCGKLKSFCEFHKHKLGRLGRDPKCKVCCAAITRQLRRRKQKAFNEWKKTLSCSRCGYNEKPSRLDFHHRDPATKSWGIGRMARQASVERLQEEMAKCDVLCIECHNSVEPRRKQYAPVRLAL
jgi:hypothetical protein